MNIFNIPGIRIFKSPPDSIKKEAKLSEKQYPAFFQELIRHPEPSKSGATKKAKILEGGIQGEALRLFVKALWGGKVLHALKEAAKDKAGPQVSETLKKTMLEAHARREQRVGSKESFTSRTDGMLRAHLPEGRLKEYEQDLQHAAAESTKVVSETHVASLQVQSTCKPLTAGDGKEWFPLKITVNKHGFTEVKEEEISPTSARAVGKSNDLTNIYVHISDKGHISISCGVIDTKEKATQFMEAVAWALNKRNQDPRFRSSTEPLRINMHQLNSMGWGPAVLVSERGLVTRQHAMVDFINANLREHINQQRMRNVYPDMPPLMDEGPFVAHINRCLNGFTQLKGEDPLSHSLNREGLAIQMGWLYHDLRLDLFSLGSVKSVTISGKQKLVDTPASIYAKKQGEVNATFEKLQKAKAELAKNESQLVEKHPPILDLQKKIEHCEAEIIKRQIFIGDLSAVPATHIVELVTAQKELERYTEERTALMEALKPFQKENQTKVKELQKEIKGLEDTLGVQIAGVK